MNIKKINRKLKDQIYILKIKPDHPSAGVASIQTALSESPINMFENFDFFESLDEEHSMFCRLTDSISKTKKFKSRVDAKKFILKNKLNGFEIIKIK